MAGDERDVSIMGERYLKTTGWYAIRSSVLRRKDARTHKIFRALDEICYEFDLSKPIWLNHTISEFQRHDKARFYQDNFVDSIDFDYLEIHIIEE